MRTLALVCFGLLFSVGCGNSPGAQFPKETEIECYAAALKPALKDGYDGATLAKRVADKQASAAEVLDAVKDDIAVAKATLKALEACRAGTPDSGAE